ncbi:DNA helicase PIF1, ATP-dependent [Corchorus olitorius]|uniref:ATP-dependent DNA helicase n=1 Tax=Corchorus olitorius TaxID=93759 RepID=A0A1R3GW27_9ROSI|nr:DNA helicase PIF1, ATP-dependent [Corchorus olitorius]
MVVFLFYTICFAVIGMFLCERCAGMAFNFVGTYEVIPNHVLDLPLLIVFCVRLLPIEKNQADVLMVNSEILSSDMLPANPATMHEVKLDSLHRALKVSVPRLDFGVLHSDIIKDSRSQYNANHSMGCAELLCPDLAVGSGCKAATLNAADFDTNMTDLHDDIGIPNTVCGDNSDDRFWEGALAQYQQILAHHSDLIDGIALGIDHILSGGFQLPVVGKADAASNRFQRKLYLANKAHTIYRQHHRMSRFGQALHSRSKVFNHVVVRSIVTSEGDLKTVKTIRSWSNDVRVSILSRFSDSTYGFICDHTAGTSNQSLRSHHFVSTGILLINEAAREVFTYPQTHSPPPNIVECMDSSTIDSNPASGATPQQMAQSAIHHKRTLYEPSYFGGLDRICPFYDAHMWYGERCDISKHTENPFTSLGAKIDRTTNSRPGPFVFSVNGLTHHKIGSVLPAEGETPKFAQLYVYDTDNEMQNRISAVCGHPNSDVIDEQIVAGLSKMLDETNEIARVFRIARERLAQPNALTMKIRFIQARGKNDRTYSAPTSSEIAALIVGQNDEVTEDRDVIIHHKSDKLERISTLHPLYMSFQYPLLFPHGEDGFHLGIRYANSPIKHAPKRGTVTMREYYAYQLQQRNVESNTLLRGGRLLHQYMADAFCSVDRGRLYHVKTRQKELRSDRYINVRDAMYQGDVDGSDIGKRIVLPASYTGGPRYMFQNYQDAMAICRAYGYPTLFITFTCNPKWREIDDALKLIPGQRADDRPDLVCRVFRLKVRDLMHDLLEAGFFGKAIAGTYTIEFQKRGLPHAHILLWLHPDSRWNTSADIDNMISAELPDPEVDRVGYDAVSSFMMHGPFGPANCKAPCMEKGHCSNPTAAIKYLFKYIHKGPDRARIVVEEGNSEQANSEQLNSEQLNSEHGVEGESQNNNAPNNVVDEIKMYLDCRYVAAHEACWRLFEFDIHFRQPPIQRLLIHLPGEQNIYFHDRQSLEKVLARPDIEKTMFTEWFEMNKISPQARSLLYIDFPTEWRACDALGLLGDDREWQDVLTQSSFSATSYEVRHVFVLILLRCNVSNPAELFERNWRLFSDDIQHKFRAEMRAPNYRVPDRDLRSYVLIALEDILLKNSSSLAESKLPQPIHKSRAVFADRMIHEELDYDLQLLRQQHIHMLSLLNPEQKIIHDDIMESVLQKKPRLFFVYGYGGTGKTFLWNTIIAGIRSKGLIVLAVASSGIASLLMPGGRTAHSRFKIPLEVDEYSTCEIRKGTQLAKLLQRTDLIVWDEAPMIHRHCLEALEKSLRDVLHDPLLESDPKPFGDRNVILGGDFRQILPVIPHGTKGDVLAATITNSELWRSFKVYTLKTNMRLQQPNMTDEYRKSLGEFAQWLLDVGDGSIKLVCDTGDDEDGSIIRIPDSLLVTCEGDPVDAMFRAIYQNFEANCYSMSFLQERAIVTPYNETATIVNTHGLSLLPGSARTYYSNDTLCKSCQGSYSNDLLHSPELLNSLRLPGVPDHELNLKIGAVVMLLRNVNQALGLSIMEPEPDPVELTISQLNKGRNTNYMILRVARRWDTILPTSGKFITIDFLFTDRNGHAIHGYMDPKLQRDHSDVLFEGHVYKISTFQVKGPKSSHNAVPGPNTILLYYSTSVTSVDIDATAFPRHHFNFATIDQIVARIKDDKIMTDVVGMLSGASNLNKIKVKRQEQEVENRTVSLKLLSGDEIKASIWARFLPGIDIDSLMQLQPKPIMLIAGTTVKGTSSNFFLTTTTGSKIFINPDIPQTTQLFESLSQDYRSLLSVNTIDNLMYAQEKTAVLLLEDNEFQQKKGSYFASAQQSSIINLLRMNPLQIGITKYKIRARIIGIDLSSGWFYTACPTCGSELNFKIFDYKPIEEEDPATKNIKGKAIEGTSAPLLLTGTPTDLALHTPQRSTPPIRSQHQQHPPPKHGETPVGASEAATPKNQKLSKKRIKPSSPKNSSGAANPQDSSSRSNSIDNRSPSSDADNQTVTNTRQNKEDDRMPSNNMPVQIITPPPEGNPPPMATSIIHLLQTQLGISFPSMTINDSPEAQTTPILIDIAKLIIAMVNQLADDGPRISNILRTWLGLNNTDTANAINIEEMLHKPNILRELYSRGITHRTPPQLALEPTSQDICFIYPADKNTPVNIDGETRITYVLTTPPLRQFWISAKFTIDHSTNQTNHKLQFMIDTTLGKYASSSNQSTLLRPIKLLIFNVAGAANPEFIYIYAETCFEYNPDFVIITETRLTGSHSQSMNFTASTSLEPIGYFGGSWFLWNDNHIKLHIIAKTQNMITFKISYQH